MSGMFRGSLHTLARLLGGLLVAFALAGAASAQQPVKIGIGIAQTGTLGGGGKAALLALQMWVEDVNKKGGLLGRKVELIAYDDQSSASTTPASTRSSSTWTRWISWIARLHRVLPAAIMP